MNILLADGPLAGQTWTGPETPRLTLIEPIPDNYRFHSDNPLELKLHQHIYKVEGQVARHQKSVPFWPFKGDVAAWVWI